MKLTEILEFPPEEMQKRIEHARSLMLQKGMSGLMVTAAANHFYFTGFRKLANWATFTRSVFVFIPVKKAPVLYVQDFEGPDAKARSSVQDVRTFSTITGAPVSGIVEILKELEMDKGMVGCELGFEQRMDMSYSDFKILKNQLPCTSFVDASMLIWELRMVKYPSEISCLRRCNDIMSSSFNRIYNEVCEGMTEKEVARKLVAIMAEEGSELPGFIIVLSGPGNYERISARPTNKRLKKGDLVWIDAGANYNGYWTDFCRAGVVGGPTSEQNRLQNIISEITMKGCAAVCPGLPVSDLYSMCANEFIANGLPFSFECGRAGHGIGLQLTEPPSVARFDDTVLKPGMVITLEPGYVNEIGCFDVEENILVTETGGEILSSAKRELYSIPLA